MDNRPFSKLISDLASLTENKIILYVERFPNPRMNGFLSRKYEQLCETMQASGHELIYLPKLLEKPDLLRGIGYFLPEFKIESKDELIQNLYSSVLEAYRFPMEDSFFVRFSRDGEKIEYWYPVEEKMLYLDSLLELPRYKVENYQILGDTNSEVHEEGVMYSISNSKCDFSPNFDFENLPEEETLDPEVLSLSLEISKKLRRLEQINGLSFLVGYLKKHMGIQTKTSPLLVDRDYKIWLTDYNKEIKMAPLNKIIYLLYLKHPEGIAFQELIDYKSELLDMYKNISNRVDVDELTENINRLVDQTGNSINEKVSMIRNFFKKEIDESLIEPYLITGERGEKRSIPLDPSLIRLEI